MELKLRSEGDYQVLSCFGQVSAKDARILRTGLRDILSKSSSSLLVLDMSNVVEVPVQFERVINELKWFATQKRMKLRLVAHPGTVTEELIDARTVNRATQRSSQSQGHNGSPLFRLVEESLKAKSQLMDLKEKKSSLERDLKNYRDESVEGESEEFFNPQELAEQFEKRILETILEKRKSESKSEEDVVGDLLNLHSKGKRRPKR